jgi:tetratricopeptide (TPR) repeat protein
LQADNSAIQNLRILPDLLSKNFAGREGVLNAISCTLPMKPHTRILRAALWGIPGVGKSQIALCFAEQRWDQYTHIFYVHATSSATIIADYRKIALRLKLQRPEDDQDHAREPQVVELVKTWLSEHSKWFMIFDNALEPAIVCGYTPVEGSGHILFTTRSQISAEVFVERSNVHEVPPMPSNEAVELALKLQNINENHSMERQAAKHLAQMAAGLPIAIEQTVCLARLRKVSLSAVLPEVEKKQALLKQSHPNSMHEDGCSTGAILALTLDTLKDQSPQAAQLFQLLVYFNPSSIPKEVITRASAEFKYHFARQETYDRGLERTAAELKEMRFKAWIARLPFYYQDPFQPDFWRTRLPFRKRLPANTLPRIDSEADRNVERNINNTAALRDVLEKPVRIENAYLDLRHAGLIRHPDDKTVWIHDLFAQLTVALLEEESQASHQVTAYTVLLMIYFVFPLPDHNKERETCFRYLPHAVSVLQYCRPFYNDLTIGPELAHLTASTFRLRISEFSPVKDGHAVDTAAFYYKLAVTGYQHALKRLREHPLVTVKEIILCARAEYAEEDGKLNRHSFTLHYTYNQRFGSAAVRALQTCLVLGAHVYQLAGQFKEAVQWTEIAAKGFQNLYGEHHDETHETRAALVRLYKRSGLWIHGDVLARVMARAYMKRWGGGLLSTPGSRIASDIGDCQMALICPEEAARWYDIALRGLVEMCGDNDRSQLIILLKLATLENSQHAHGKSLRLAQKALEIFRETCRAEPHWNWPSRDRLIDIELIVARQQFELGNLDAAKNGCERALGICKWDPDIDHADYTDYRSVWDSGLEAIWLWGCVAFAESSAPEDWNIPSLSVTQELSKQALDKYGPLRGPCCGKEYGSEGRNPGTGVAAQCQYLLRELGED